MGGGTASCRREERTVKGGGVRIGCLVGLVFVVGESLPNLFQSFSEACGDELEQFDHLWLQSRARMILA